MREGWEIKNLNDVCENIFAGGDVPKSNFSKIKTDNYRIPIFANGATNKGLYGYTDIEKVIKSSITVSARGTIGYSEIRTESFFPIVRLIVLTPNTDIISLPFLKYVISSLDFKNSGTSIPQLTVPMIKKYNSPIPPLPEQHQIVAILDKAFAAIDQAKANMERNLENAKELFQSRLEEVFYHPDNVSEIKRLKNICRYDKIRNVREDLPYVGLEHIESNTGRFLGSRNICKVKSSTFYFDETHILYGRLRPYLNKVFIPDFEGHCSTEIFPISVNHLLLRDYLFYWLIAGKTVTKINSTWTGARMPRANMNEVLEFKIPVPSIDSQKEIIVELDEINKNIKLLEEKYRNKIETIDELKKSVLQKAFTGELIKETKEAAYE